jgi:formylglycine-generating enzyme required for sulfatase activity
MHALLLAAASVAIALIAEPQGRGKIAPPPGLVLVEGGPTKVGSTVAYIEQVAKESPDVLPGIAAESPQHEVRVDDFFAMVTEVTNEQYSAFVEATGWRPPELWGAQAIDEASRAYLEDLEKRIRDAKAEGKPAPERVPFDRSRWWRDNWEGKPWTLPKGKEAHPVVYVDYKDARSYARWAGLRLMTEFEFQRAGRGKTDNLYPWGAEADPSRAVTREARRNEVQAVASRRAGATAIGIHDLSGNAWEWTSSPFVAYPGFKVLQIKVGAGKAERLLEGLVDWNADQRVVVGGCFQTSIFAARVTTRRATDRNQSTDALGFRCAATVVPGRDLAAAVMDSDLPLDKRPADVVYDVNKASAADHWTSKPGTATTTVKGDKGEDKLGPIPGYAIITGYDYLMFIPAVEIDCTSVDALAKLSRTAGVVHLGVLATTKALMVPAVGKGTYMVAFRAAGEPPPPPPAEKGAEGKPVDAGGKGQGTQEPAPQEPAPQEPAAAVQVQVPPGYDWTTNNLIFYDAAGAPVGWMLAPDFDYARPQEPTVLIADGTHSTRTKDEKTGKITITSDPATVVTMKLNSWVRVSSKGFAYSLQLKVKPGEITKDWRHP